MSTGRAIAAVTSPPPAPQPRSTVDQVLQPFGFLIGIDAATGVVEVVSANLAAFVECAPADALGSSIAALLGDVVSQRLPAPARDGRADAAATVRLPPRPGTAPADASPEHATDAGAAGTRERWQEFDVVGHHAGRLWVLEFEPAGTEEAGLRSLHDSFARTLDHLRSVDGAAALCTVAVEEVRALTGYDRVLVYRFENPPGAPGATPAATGLPVAAAGSAPGGSASGGSAPGGTALLEGRVIAEARRADLDPYEGLDFPVGTVATRSQELYLRGWTRVVADTADEPVGLVCSAGAAAELDPDQAVQVLRAAFGLDPVLLQEVSVRALLTVPIVIDGRLWGLLTAHHALPRRLPRHLRDSCAMLARVLSLQVRAADARLAAERSAVLGRLVAEVVSAMAAAPSLAAGAEAARTSLLRMVDADGVVVQIEGRRVIAGRVPATEDLDDLVQRVAAAAAGAHPPWAAEALPAGGSIATGVLYLPFGGREGSFALWLRAETPRTLSWAHPGTSRSGQRPVLVAEPEVVPGTSRAWAAPERAAAETLARALPALLLNRAHRVLIEQEVAAGRERLVAAADRQKLEHELQQHQRLESLGQLAGGVAHDFNNLLSVILNYCEFVADEVDTEVRVAGSDRWRAVQGDVEEIKGAAGRAADLTRQLLAFARREVVRPRPLNINHVVRGVEKMLDRMIGEGVELRLDLAADLPTVLADPGQVEQVLVNLAVNARDAMPTGGVLTIQTADVDLTDRDAAAEGGRRQVRLRVADTGSGIPPEIVDRVFEPFFTTKPAGDGTGLGLATVHGIVAQIGGVVHIDSVAGAGTSFTIDFPATSLSPSAPDVPQLRPAAGGATVLVVEDGDELRDVTRRLLARAGYEVLTAANGYQAVEVAAHHQGRVDLLLTDMIMPFMTGDEVAERVRELHPGVRVVFMSGYAQPLLSAGGRLAPGHLLLDKPFSRSALLIKVLEALDLPAEQATAPRPR